MKTTTENGLIKPLLLLYTRILAVIYFVGFAIWYAMADGLRDRSGTPLGADFINIYAAGVMALRGQASFVYSWPLHDQVEQAVVGYNLPYCSWHYPPMFLGLAVLVALVPYLWAFALYMAGGITAYGLVLWRLIPKGREYVWALAAFPGAFDNLINGQNGFMTTAMLGAGVLRLETQPWMAGVLFGLMSYKPQFFIVIPLMLAVGGYGRALLATFLTALGIMALSWAVFGTNTWLAFISSMPATQHLILEQSNGWQKIQSVFAWVRMWGGSVPFAYLVQGAVSGAALMISTYVWRRQASYPTRIAVLCAAMLLVTPYLLDYDLVILAVPIAMLTKQGIESGFLRGEKLLLVLLWLLPLVARNVGSYGVSLTPPLLALLLALCLRRSRTS